MKKPVIGILATSNYMLTNDAFLDTYRYGNNYINRIVVNGGVPLSASQAQRQLFF